MRNIIFAKKNKKGMTIVELLVAIFILSLGMIGVVLLFSSAWKTNSYVLEEGSAIVAASRTLEQTMKDIRRVRQADDGSYAIKSVQDFDLVVYLDTNNDSKAERVHYFLENTDFKKGVTKSSGNFNVYPADDEIVTTIAQHVMNTSSQPIFTYYNNLYPIDLENNPLSDPRPSDVRLIGVHLWVNIKPKTAPDNINLESFAELRNLNEKK